MSQGYALEMIADREFYETIDHYQPQDELLNVVQSLLPDTWKFGRNGVWHGCNPNENHMLPTEGWKIHISSSVSNAEDILKAVVPIFAKGSVSFKFALDRRILAMMNGKGWARQGAGKFITVYPLDEEHFKTLIEEVYQVTKQFEGLYILSDKRYKDSKIVFYRYGGIRPFAYLDVTGRKVSMLEAADGSGRKIQDVRRPYFFVPEWAKDPFAEVPADAPEQAVPEQITLKDGRYLVKHPLGFSNSGGVYVAEDTTTGQEVVIKEARPYLSTTENSISLLEKEYRILSKIAHTGMVPKPLDFFHDWEHSFLVLELLTGTSLSSFSARHNLNHLTHPTIDDTLEFYRKFKTIFLQLAEILKVIHEHNIVVTDFSPNNVVIDPDTLKLKMIDFEGAYEIDKDEPVYLYTPGFAPPAQMYGGAVSNFESDYFSFGATMHYFLAPVNQIFMINPQARYTFVNSVTTDNGFPGDIGKLVSGLIDKDPEKRPKPSEIIEILENAEGFRSPNLDPDKKEIETKCRKYIKEISKYIRAKADYERTDRLFPADGRVFGTNPMSISHGALGVAGALRKMDGKVPKRVTNWILARNKNPLMYPPGLYIGLSGVAWGMLDIGLRDEAQDALKSTFDHSLLYDSTDLYYGLAGWGMANLKFFNEFQDEIYLLKAIEAGDFIISAASENEKGMYWESEDGIHMGYAHGASGRSLFLLYLYLASRKERFLEAGIKALDFDINNASPNLEDGLSWKRMVNQGRIVYPYWRYGSAGVGTAVVRYYRLLREERYRDVLEKIFIDTNRKYAVFPGFANGLAGLGEFLLDLHQVTNESHHLDGAYRVASGLSLFAIEKEEGIAFPGEGLRRISCDYSTGSAGIGHFFRRLVYREEGTYQLDRLFVNAENLVMV
jgi:serine/threonine protein kinase